MFAGPSRAQPEVPGETDAYRAAVADAVQAFSQQNFAEARVSFARAHALFPSARTLRGLGMAELELRDYAACVAHLEAALASDVRPLDAAMRADVQHMLTQAKAVRGGAAQPPEVDSATPRPPPAANASATQQPLPPAQPSEQATQPSGQSAPGSMRLMAGASLGLGGREEQHAGDYDEENNLSLSPGGLIGFTYVPLRYLGIAAKASLLSLHSHGELSDHKLLWDLTLEPSARLPLLARQLELFVALPVGLTIAKLSDSPAGYAWLDKTGATLGISAGAAYFVSQHLGFGLEAGVSWHWFKALDYRTFEDTSFAVFQGSLMATLLVAFGSRAR